MPSDGRDDASIGHQSVPEAQNKSTPAEVLGKVKKKN
jgi:hypothetical protein